MTPYIIKNENALFYECGYSCDNGYFLRLKKEAFFITDSRYTVEAKEVIKNATVLQGDRRDLLKTVRKLLKGTKSLTINSSEWSLEEYKRLNKKLSTKLIEKPNFSQIKREIKSEKEVKILKKASKLGAQAFDEFAKFIQEEGIGKTERELHFKAENIFKSHGKLGLSFSPIVAINENAAKPHALPSKKILKKGDLLLLDAGVLYKRYCSDRTRTAYVDENFNFSKKQKFKNKFQQKIYDIVLKSQEAGIKKAKAGVRANEVDKACREVIEKAGYGKYFIHSAGHGVGIDIHELPVINTKNKKRLEANSVFSVEPGIYLPGEFGVRIEDVVRLTDRGAEIL